MRTCEIIGKELNRNGFIMRYTAEDDFGLPETAFLVCQFWYIDALVGLDRKDEARELFTDLLARRNSFGLLSEDIHPVTGELWGNLPQTYSMAGIVNTARIVVAQLAGGLGAALNLRATAGDVLARPPCWAQPPVKGGHLKGNRSLTARSAG